MVHTAFSHATTRLCDVTDAMTARILVAEDDRAVRESLVRALQLEGYTVASANNGAEALEAVRQAEPDVLLLDVSMPVVDGLTVCRVLRSEGSKLPVLMLTARIETSDRVAGLDAGADDYLPKPYDLDELLARIRARHQGRRAAQAALDQAARLESCEHLLSHLLEHPEGELVLGDLRLDTSGRRAFRGEREIQLSKTEFDLLALLVANRGIVLDHSTIYDRIWHYDFGPDSKNLAVYIGYLRRKTEAEGEPRIVHTVRGVGYTARIDS